MICSTDIQSMSLFFIPLKILIAHLQKELSERDQNQKDKAVIGEEVRAKGKTVFERMPSPSGFGEQRDDNSLVGR